MIRMRHAIVPMALFLLSSGCTPKKESKANSVEQAGTESYVPPYSKIDSEFDKELKAFFTADRTHFVFKPRVLEDGTPAACFYYASTIAGQSSDSMMAEGISPLTETAVDMRVLMKQLKDKRDWNASAKVVAQAGSAFLFSAGAVFAFMSFLEPVSGTVGSVVSYGASTLFFAATAKTEAAEIKSGEGLAMVEQVTNALKEQNYDLRKDVPAAIAQALAEEVKKASTTKALAIPCGKSNE